MRQRDKLYVTVSSKGQISLPSALREAADIRQGDRLVLEPQEDGTILMRRDQPESFASCIGAWRDRPDEPLEVDAFLAEIRGPIDP
jgi:AbrB family looped-hinge helix DNA binding protein